MLRRLSAHGGQLIYADVRKSGHRARKMHKLLGWLAPEAELPEVKTFKRNDGALEYAENELLKELGHTSEEALEDVLWALINSKEFLYRH